MYMELWSYDCMKYSLCHHQPEPENVGTMSTIRQSKKNASFQKNEVLETIPISKQTLSFSLKTKAQAPQLSLLMLCFKAVILTDAL